MILNILVNNDNNKIIQSFFEVYSDPQSLETKQ